MNIAEVIKYEGDNNTFIWKHPSEDFNSFTQLIVHESQEAIFFMNGQALDSFGPGRHTLETQNIPKIGKLFNRTTNNETPFHCEVYFINKTEQMSIRWGTDSQVQYMEPTYKFPISLGASGEMSLRVDNGRKLLLKLVGTESVLSQSKLVTYFKAFLMTRVKPYIASYMKSNAVSIFELDEHLMIFSNVLKEQLAPDFLDYGISLERFFVTNVVKPDGESSYERFKKLFFEQSIGIQEERLQQQRELIRQETASQKAVMQSAARAKSRQQEGYTYQQERGFDVAQELAKNEGVGNFTNAGIGLGMMAGVGGGMGAAVANLTTQAMSPINDAISMSPQPVDSINGSSEMPPVISLKPEEDTEPVPAVPQTAGDPLVVFRQKVEMLKIAKENGILSDDEFNEKKSALLKEIGF